MSRDGSANAEINERIATLLGFAKHSLRSGKRAQGHRVLANAPTKLTGVEAAQVVKGVLA